ncbi:Uncharacterised protein [Bacteroides xylanisolvens]|nr:Uncharacterised protein [Bacteroides xylanisolvens]
MRGQKTFMAFIYFLFSILFRKNIYLCHTLSAHQRDETGEGGFYSFME